MKKILLSLVALIFLVSVALAIKTIVVRPNDPQNFVNTAISNSFEINSAKTTSLIQITADTNKTGKGEFALMIDGKISKATEYLPTLDYQIESVISTNFEGQAISGKIKGELKIIDEVFYGKFEEIEFVGASDEILAKIESINKFAGKWFSLSFAKLKELDPEIATTLEEQKIRQLEIRENLKKLFATTDFLIVKKMPISLNELQPVEVVFNKNILSSDIFLAELEKILTMSDSKNPFGINETVKTQIREILSQIADKVDSTINLEISRDDNVLRAYSAELNLNLSDFGLPQFTDGEMKIILKSQSSEINQPQPVAIPAEFTKLDPFELIPHPVGIENEIESTE